MPRFEPEDGILLVQVEGGKLVKFDVKTLPRRSFPRGSVLAEALHRDSGDPRAREPVAGELLNSECLVVVRDFLRAVGAASRSASADRDVPGMEVLLRAIRNEGAAAGSNEGVELLFRTAIAGRVLRIPSLIDAARETLEHVVSHATTPAKARFALRIDGDPHPGRDDWSDACREAFRDDAKNAEAPGILATARREWIAEEMVDYKCACGNDLVKGSRTHCRACGKPKCRERCAIFEVQIAGNEQFLLFLNRSQMSFSAIINALSPTVPVCRECNQHLHQLRRPGRIKREAIFLMAPSLPVLRKCHRLSTELRDGVLACAGALRAVQHLEPGETIHPGTARLLWTSRRSWPGHPRMMAAFIRSVKWSSPRSRHEALLVLDADLEAWDRRDLGSPPAGGGGGGGRPACKCTGHDYTAAMCDAPCTGSVAVEISASVAFVDVLSTPGLPRLVRAHAVRMLERLPHSVVRSLLLPIVLALRHESRPSRSDLARFLCDLAVKDEVARWDLGAILSTHASRAVVDPFAEAREAIIVAITAERGVAAAADFTDRTFVRAQMLAHGTLEGIAPVVGGGGGGGGGGYRGDDTCAYADDGRSDDHDDDDGDDHDDVGADHNDDIDGGGNGIKVGDGDCFEKAGAAGVSTLSPWDEAHALLVSALGLTLPFRPDRRLASVERNAQVYDSATAPLIVTYTHRHAPFDEDRPAGPAGVDVGPASPAATATTSRFMLKPEDVRSDYVVMCAVRLMNKILLEAGIDLDIVTYAVLPTSAGSGVVEFVDGSLSLSSLGDATGVITYLSEQIDPEGPSKTIADVRRTFVRSIAATWLISHLFGIRDRHTENILIHRGRVFNIDFGYILGETPIQHRATGPSVPLASALIGVLSKKPEELADLENYCVEAFLALRPHFGLFATLFAALGSAEPPVFSNRTGAQWIVNELRGTFKPGFTDEEAEKYLRSEVLSAKTKTDTASIFRNTTRYVKLTTTSAAASLSGMLSWGSTAAGATTAKNGGGNRANEGSKNDH